LPDLGDAVGDLPDAVRLAGRNQQRMAGPEREEDVDFGRRRIEQMGDADRPCRLARRRCRRLEVEAGVGEAAGFRDRPVGCDRRPVAAAERIMAALGRRGDLVDVDWRAGRGRRNDEEEVG